MGKDAETRRKLPQMTLKGQTYIACVEDKSPKIHRLNTCIKYK